MIDKEKRTWGHNRERNENAMILCVAAVKKANSMLGIIMQKTEVKTLNIIMAYKVQYTSLYQLLGNMSGAMVLMSCPWASLRYRRSNCWEQNPGLNMPLRVLVFVLNSPIPLHLLYSQALVDDLLKSGKTSIRIISGGWSFWGAWSSCSRDCELGFRTRKRTCTNPEPKNGGLPCIGSAVEYQDCNSHPCPVKGSWSCWTPWSQCSATCGGGHYQRTRTCTNPAPSNGEDICIGLHTEEALCNTHLCEGGWSEWSEWSLCNEDGIQYRSRYCEIHSPGSPHCAGNSTQYQDCLYNEIPGRHNFTC
ncbi:Semaphorin-5B [Varanus komodoensis]|nr:Semaphorin-5B [Varanus komodoensis]